MLPFLLAPLMSSFLAPAATTALAGMGLGSLAPMAGSALTGALTSGVMGGNPLTGAITGGMGPALSGGVNALTEGLNAGASTASMMQAADPIITPASWSGSGVGGPATIIDPNTASSTFMMNNPPYSGSGVGGPYTVVDPNTNSSTFFKQMPGSAPDLGVIEVPGGDIPMETPPPMAPDTNRVMPPPVQPTEPMRYADTSLEPFVGQSGAGPTDLSPQPAEKSWFDKTLGWVGDNPIMAMGLGAMAVDQIGRWIGDDDEEDSNSKYSEKKGSRTVTAAPAGYKHGTDPEWKFISYNRGFAEGGKVDGWKPAPDVDTATMEAIEALSGRHPNPDAALERLRELIGDDMFEQFMESFGQGRKVEGPGGGQDDMVPAMIAGGQPAALSDGEFVVPADVVSGLGDGSTDAGVAQLDRMIKDVRKKRGMGAGLPPLVNAPAVMPA